ncbi:hypothetical protein [Ehrlichia chaffeensis]|uniref:hypothetical protein n=1 Tax=Ehrlichia chaffeensis TaxID=945 RepID=UPI0012D2A614|nr:hypothetical protein [Ehrlichia chaffeensis]
MLVGATISGTAVCCIPTLNVSSTSSFNPEASSIFWPVHAFPILSLTGDLLVTDFSASLTGQTVEPAFVTLPTGTTTVVS